MIKSAVDNAVKIPSQPIINRAAIDRADNSVKSKENHPDIIKTEAAYKTDALEKIIDDLNKKLFATGRELVRSIHEKTGQVMVKVVSTESGEIIREIPYEKSLDILARILEQSGLLIDELT